MLREWGSLRLAEDLVHFPSFGKFINQFVEVTGLLGQWGLDILDAVAADGSGDQVGIWIEDGFGEELFKGGLFFDLGLECFGVESG